jgi:DNA-binding transcriptional LysR family regulator
MSDEQLPHLETFAEAAERGSFTAAGKALGMTQAAVSQRIHALEERLGVPLFDRQGGHVVLTDAGHRLHGYAQRILALHREAMEELTGKRAALSGELSLAASSVPGEHLLPDLLTVFRERHPHIQVRATIADSRQVQQQLEQGQAHLGLVGGKTDSPNLEYRVFATDELAVIVPAKHPWARRKRLALEQLYEQPLILREPGSGSRWCLEQALARVGKVTSALQVALELGSNEAIKEAVLRGLGLAILSTHTVRHEVEAGTLHALPIADLPLTREMFVVWDRRRALPIPARLFLDLLAAAPHATRPR